MLKQHSCRSSPGIWRDTAHISVFLVALWQCLASQSQGALAAGMHLLEGAASALKNIVRRGNGLRKVRSSVKSTRFSKAKEQTTKWENS